MKVKILFFLYAAAILLFSGFARGQDFANPGAAQEVPFRIQQVTVDPISFELHLLGSTPNSCYNQIIARIVRQPEFPEVLWVRVTLPIPEEICTDQIQEGFSTTVDLKQTIANAELRLEEEKTYSITIEGSDLTFEASGAQLLSR
jgi:hypothetical protein